MRHGVIAKRRHRLFQLGQAGVGSNLLPDEEERRGHVVLVQLLDREPGVDAWPVIEGERHHPLRPPAAEERQAEAG